MYCCLEGVVKRYPLSVQIASIHIWGPIRNFFATSHVTVNLLLSATSQNLYEWGLWILMYQVVVLPAQCPIGHFISFQHYVPNCDICDIHPYFIIAVTWLLNAVWNFYIHHIGSSHCQSSIFLWNCLILQNNSILWKDMRNQVIIIFVVLKWLDTIRHTYKNLK